MAITPNTAHKKKPCSRCYKSFKREELPDHLKTCEYRRCRRCARRKSPNQIHLCTGPSSNRRIKKECSRCRKHFEPEEIAKHQKACGFRQCRHCRKRKGPGQRHDCPKKPPPRLRKQKCRQCGKLFPFDKMDEHSEVCKFTKCSIRKTRIPPDTFHECPKPKLRCTKCCKQVLAEEIGTHSRYCKYRKCPTCKKGIPLDITHDCPKKHHIAKKQCPDCFKSLPPDQLKPHREDCKFARCNKCGRSNPVGSTTHNCLGPQASRCPRCSKSIQIERLNEHIAGCKLKVCSKCSRRVLVGDLHECGRKVCSSCGKSLLERDFPEHQLKCEVKRCWQCRKGNILKKEFLQHLQQECGKKYCWKCGKGGIRESEFTRHQDECNMIRSPNCQRRLTNDAIHLCQFVRCHCCIKPVLKTEYPDHRLVCSSVLSKKRLALGQSGSCSWLQHITSTPCPRPRVNGLLHCRKHAEMRNLNKQRQENTEVEKQRFRHVLLHRGGQVSRWQSSSMAESMQTWAQLPKNVAICDIEACNLGRSISHLNVFEIAIANANGQWIIPPTIINHEITKRQLFEANAGTLVNNLVFSKFYGDANETEARGNGKRTATWKELGQELESYIANEGPIVEWFEWSSYNIDWQRVYAGLVSVGFEHLLPPMPSTERRPLLWFRKIRAALKLENLGLSLGNLFAILYPEYDELLAQAHYAGPDVEMLIKVIKYLFANLEGSQIPGKIENYFHVIDIDLSGINGQNDDRAEEGSDTEEGVEVGEMKI